jgi:diguanylate cyclase (GGDEF)-like protein
MEVLRSAVAGIDAAPAMPEDPELSSLRAHVARLEAEREALQWAAGHDELTGLPNRRLFKALATSVIDTAADSAALLMLDLDGFKPINDRFGHATGDHVLRIIAARLAAWAGDNLVARLGGDEFAILLTSSPPARLYSWRSAMWTLAALIAQPIHLSCQAVAVTASIGIAPCRGASVGELLHHADIAMYRAKQHTKNTGISGTACVYSPALERGRTSIPSQPMILELTIVKVKRDGNPPPGDPSERDPEAVARPDTYSVGDPVWVHRHGAWRPGVIEATSSRAILARYRPSDGPGTGVDTVAAEHVASR